MTSPRPPLQSLSMGRARRRAIATAAAVVLVLSVAASGCGTVCGDAIEVCRYDPASEPDDCSGATECASLCVLDWDACDVNNPDSPESKCIASCLAAAEQP